MNLRLPLAIIVVALLVACSPRQIHNTDERPVPLQAQTQSLANLEKAIIEAGAPRGWVFTKAAEGHLLATYARNDWSATVNILFNQKTYRITYNNSVNLKKNGDSIHYNYNRWVNNLDEDIQLKLAQLRA